MDAVTTMSPARRSHISGITARAPNTTPSTLTPIARRYSSSVIRMSGGDRGSVGPSSTLRWVVMPALRCTKSKWSCAAIKSAHASLDDTSSTSARTLSRALVVFSASWSISTMVTVAPALTSASATAAPMPLAPPVIRALRPERFMTAT